MSRARKKRRRSVRSVVAAAARALVPAASKTVASPKDDVRTAWLLYLDWCRWRPVAWYVSFGEWMRLVLEEEPAAGTSAAGQAEHRAKQVLVLPILTRLLSGYGLSLAEERALYVRVRPLWRGALSDGSADPLDGFDGWLGRMVAAKDQRTLSACDGNVYNAVTSHLKGVVDGVLGTKTRSMKPILPNWLAAAAGDDTDIPESASADSIQRIADEVRRRPPTEAERKHARGSIHNWGF